MYVNTYLAIPLWIFAIFGLLYFLLRFFDSLGILGKKSGEAYTLIISAKNQEEALEGIIRGFILKAGLDDAKEQLLNIVLVDLGSGDQTPKIMEKLSNQYAVIKLLRPNSLRGYLTNLMLHKK